MIIDYDILIIALLIGFCLGMVVGVTLTRPSVIR